LVAGLCGFVVLLIAATAVAITLTMQKERERADADSVAQFLSDLFVAAIPKDRDPSSLTALEVLDAGVARLDRYTANQPVRRALLLEALGKTYRELSAHDRAETLLRESLAIRLEHLGERHADTLETMCGLGVLCRKIGRTDESIELNERALAGRRALFGDRHELVTQSMNNLAVSYQAANRSEDALKLLDEASRITIEMLGVEDDKAITQRANYGLQLAVAGRKDAVSLMEDLYATARRSLGDSHVATLHTGYGLGLAYMKADRFRDAVEVLDPVYTAEKRVFGERALDTASAGYFLGDALRRLGESQRGFDLLAEAHDIGVEIMGEGNDWVLNVQLKAALALIDLGEFDAARLRASNALRLAQASTGAARSKIPEAERILADLDAREPSEDDK
jgi:tetratricopeptide (TPR) repeat protein